MPKYLTASEALPDNFVTRQQLVDFVQSLQADAAFTDDTTIGVVAGALVVKEIPTSKVTGLDTALTGKQASSALLAALAGVPSAANTFPYFTGTNAADVAAVTAFARGLLDDVDQAQARQTLGLDPKTAVADVDDSALPANGAISALTSSATTTQAEFNALRDACEGVRDAVAACVVTIEALRDRFESGGLGLLEDS